jgi:hypothetical protein
MRRREKFVIAAVVLSICLLFVQYTSLEYRYWVMGAFMLLTYGISSWTLSDDLQRHERFMIVPLPTLYAGAVGLFYFLLPVNVLTRIFILVLFGIGMYALYLTSNIYSVAKGRTIQLLHAAHAIGFLFTLLTSLLFANTIFSLRLPFYVNGALIGLTHFPLVLSSLWAVRLETSIRKELYMLSALITLLLIELAVVMSFMPHTIWYQALFIMSLLYLCVSIIRSFLAERLFMNAVTEYSLVGFFLFALFLLVFPTK